MWRAQLRERPAAVYRAVHPGVQDIDGLGAFGIGMDMRVIPRALAEIALVVGAAPRVAAVFGSEDAAGVGFDDRPYAVMIGGHCDADLADHAFREAVVAGDLLPRVAAIGGLEQSGARPAARHVRRPAARLPDRRKENPRIGGVQREIHGAGGIRPEQHFLPGLAAVFGPEHAALGIRPERVAEYGDVHEVGVRGMDADRADLARVPESDVGPCLAGVGGFVNAIPRRHVAADR